MLSSIQHMPTLGYFNKIICDSLSLWSSDKKDILFNVPATEKERRKVLLEAFDAIKRDDGSYGSLDELVSVTTQISPKQREKNKKNKTIQEFTNFFSKEDFSSYDELIEFEDYINIVIEDKYTPNELSKFVSKLYTSSIMYYGEFIREHAVKPGGQLDSYIFFVNNILINLVGVLVDEESINTSGPSPQNIAYDVNKWPLRSFVDSVTNLCNVSLNRLHQFNEVRLHNKKYTDEAIWNSDLKSESINTRSKQVIDRLTKNNKIKWDTFYEVIKPLIFFLPEGTDKDNFTIKAYSAFLTHNITNHIRKIDFPGNTNISSSQKYDYPLIQSESSFLPISNRIDSMFNDIERADDIAVQVSMDGYRDMTKKLQLISSSLFNDFEVPTAIDLLYSKEIVDFPIEVLRHKLDKTPLWIDEWSLAKQAVASGNNDSALDHYKKSFEAAKYLAGSLFVFLYIEICAFCKHQYQALSKRNEEELFDRLYEPLGSEAAKYAILIGYAPSSSRDPKTLMSKSVAPLKNGLLIGKIDSMQQSSMFKKC